MHNIVYEYQLNYKEWAMTTTEFNVKFENLIFTRKNDDLSITDTTDVGFEEVRYVDFFNGVPVYTITALDSDGTTPKTYTLLTDAEIIVNLADQDEGTKAYYYGTDYNENITTDAATLIVSGGKGDDTINLTNGTEKVNFYDGDGYDIVNNAITTNSLHFDDADFNAMKFYSDGDDLLIVHSFNGAVRITDAIDGPSTLSDTTVQTFFVGENEYSINNMGFIDNCYDQSDFVKGKFTNLTGDSVKVIAEDYLSSKGKGVEIKTGIGSDYIFGSAYNDKINSKDGSNIITEFGGKNNIKTGAGADTITLEGYSSNTVKAGDGLNQIYIDSIGVNKVTTGKWADKFFVNTGINTIKAGDGMNVINLNGGVNNVKTGKETDTFNITGGNNTIKSGKGDSVFTISAATAGGCNNITTGKGIAEFTIGSGMNTIKTGKGDAKFGITGGLNTINTTKSVADIEIEGAANIITSGKSDDKYKVSGEGITYITDKGGSDTYNLFGTDYNTAFVSIDDKKGSNNIIFSENIKDYDIYFDVKAGKKGKDNNYKYTIGKTVAFTTMNLSGVVYTGFEMTLNKGKLVGTINTTDDGDITLAQKYSLGLDEVAQNVANWLGTKEGFNSTADVFAKGDTATINEMLALYGTVGNCLDAPEVV